jgi:hypothetical protein
MTAVEATPRDVTAKRATIPPVKKLAGTLPVPRKLPNPATRPACLRRVTREPLP